MSTIDAKTLELVASKICHDLISPIGAINNGLEIFEEMGPDAGPDVTALISSSAQIASAKLKAYRIAYGAGGSDANIKLEDAYKTIGDIVAHESRLTQEWDPNAGLGPEMLPTGTAKIITAFLLLSMECLPRGGALSVSHNDEGHVVIAAIGERPVLKDGFTECLHQSVNLADMSPGVTHAFVTGFLAKHYGFDIIDVEHTDSHLKFVISLPSA